MSSRRTRRVPGIRRGRFRAVPGCFRGIAEGRRRGRAEAASVAAPLVAHVQRRARTLARVRLAARPPFPPERCAERCGVVAIRRLGAAGSGAALDPAPAERGRPRWTLTVDAAIPPHTPQWNGAVALALGRALLPPGAADETLAEIGAAEILLPARPFRSAAARTDLTMDGLRELAMRFSAPIRLTLRQWLLTGTWRGYALLWREEGGAPVLRWRAASPSERFPASASIGAPAERVFPPQSRFHATLRTGRAHHGVEEVRTGAGPAWWFTRFGVVRGAADVALPPGGGRAVLALVVLDRTW